MKPALLKRIVIFIWIVSTVVLYQNPLAAQTPDFKIITSDTWGPGLWSRVDIEISGGGSAGPCRLVQGFPVGFSVRPVSSAGYDMFFTNNTVYVVWTSLPGVKSFTVSYEVMPERSLSGAIILGGEFYFVTGANTRLSVSVPPKEIRIDISGTGKAEPATEVLPSEGGVVFRIQVLTSGSRMTDRELKNRLGLDFQEEVTLVPAGKVIKYQVGSYSSVESAGALLKKFKSGGVTEAFIVAYRNGEQITLEQARSISK